MTLEETKSLETRIAEIEDRLAIYNLIAMHPLSADSGDAELVRSIYSEDLKFDRGAIQGASGVEGLVAVVQSAEHRAAIAGGLAHFPGLPMVELKSSELAYATSYIAICHYNKELDERHLPNHGKSRGFSIFRIVANRWHLAKQNGRWRVTERNLYPLDGTPDAQKVIQEAKSIIADD